MYDIGRFLSAPISPTTKVKKEMKTCKSGGGEYSGWLITNAIQAVTEP